MASIAEIYGSVPARYPELRDKVAIVTGSSRGIGAGIAARLAREGMRVVITGLDVAETEAAAGALRNAGAETLALPGDLTTPEAIDQLFARTLSEYGGLHLLVNNAADLRRAPVDVLGMPLIELQIAINLRTPLLCALRAVAIMKRAGEGSIVNISSVGGLRVHNPGLPYDLTKGALDAMTRALGVEIAATGIRVNAVAPGWTPVIETKEDEDYVRDMAPFVPMNKAGRPQDIGALVAFLASDDATYITGQVIYVDGGLATQLHPPGQPI